MLDLGDVGPDLSGAPGFGEPVKDLRRRRRARRVQAGSLVRAHPAVGGPGDRGGEAHDGERVEVGRAAHVDRAADDWETGTPVVARVENDLAGGVRPVPGAQGHVVDGSSWRRARRQDAGTERVALEADVDRRFGVRPGYSSDPGEGSGGGELARSDP